MRLIGTWLKRTLKKRMLDQLYSLLFKIVLSNCIFCVYAALEGGSDLV